MRLSHVVIVSLAALAFGCEKKPEATAKPEASAPAEAAPLADFPSKEASSWVNGEPRALRGGVVLVEAWHSS